MNFFKNLEIRDKKILFSFLVAILLTFLIDSKLTLFIFELNEPFKSFFHTATKFGDSFYYLIIIVLLFFILRVKKNISPIFKNLYDLNTFIFYNIMLSGIVAQILKHIVGRPRPKMLLSEYQSFDIQMCFIVLRDPFYLIECWNIIESVYKIIELNSIKDINILYDLDQ